MDDNLKELSELKVFKNYGTHDRTQVVRALEYAKRAHQKQKRKSGEAYIIHPIAVALIVMELEVIPEIVISALLHDVLEDTPIDFEEIHHEFGFHIAKIVNTLSKSHKIQILKHDTDEERKLIHHQFLDTIKDPKAALVKVADRLNNMRTLEHLSEEQQKRISTETVKMYVPLAKEMGVQQISEELDKLASKYLNNDEYQSAFDHSKVYEKEIIEKGYHKDAIEKCLMENI